MQNKNILVTAIGSFSSPAVISELHKMGCIVIGTDIYEKEWVAESQEVDRFYQAPLASSEKEYIDFIKEVVEKEKISYLVPLIDVEIDVLNRHRKELQDLGLVLCMSGEEDIDLLRNKFELSAKVGGVLEMIQEPELMGAVRVIPTSPAVDVDFENVTYPLILKPINGRSSSGLYRIYQEDQLGFAFSSIIDPEKLDDRSLENYIVQPLIKGNVITVDIVRDSQNHMNVVAREELLRTPNGAGLTVNLFKDPVLEKICRKLAKELGILGAVNLEFIKGEGSGVYYFIECNPRFSGGVAFSELAGVPVVSNSMKCFFGETIEEIPEYTCGFMTRKYIECKM